MTVISVVPWWVVVILCIVCVGVGTEFGVYLGIEAEEEQDGDDCV